MIKARKILAMTMLVAVLGITLISTNTYAANDEIIKGDINGDGKINITDVTKISAYLVKKINLDKTMLARADYDGDGSVTTKDRDLIAQIVKGGIKLGDMNGDEKINITDVIKVAAHIAGKRQLSDEMLKIADVDKNGKVDKEDLLLISGKAKGQVKYFPAETKKGDINLDGKVNVTDRIILTAFLKGYRTFKYEFYKVQADYNGDGKINVTDLTKLVKDLKDI
ncbi:MAG: dockerin type I repeat-containing protein [Clostridia bacterium]|nr:dockerin type I repeat-containing protein [Clostridia bacterium]